MAANVEICHRCDFRQRGCNGRCPCTADAARRDIIAIARAGDCPKQYFTLGLPPAHAAPPARPQPFDGSRMWAELHRRPAQFDAADPLAETAERAWLDAFAARLPCGACKRDWLAIVAANPPKLLSAGEYFDWTWAVHELVNSRIGKPAMTLADAKERWMK